MKKKSKILSGAMALIMAVSLLAVPSTTAKAGLTLKNPVITEDSSRQAGQRVIYDCVYFGSYPQAEVVPSEAAETTIDSAIRNGDDYIVDATLYRKLQNATWVNNETTIGTDRFRRMKSGDALVAYYGYLSGYFMWKDKDSYHYFKYQPIKWRVLKANSKEAFLLADIALDNQKYHEEQEAITWETCSLRSFLNQDFYQSAFNDKEKRAILKAKVENKDNLYNGTEGGNNTSDKIFLLSESEVYADSAKVYGYINGYRIYDEARRCRSSAYAKAMGCQSGGGRCAWWLRSTGAETDHAVRVCDSGNVDCYGVRVGLNDYGVRPALKLNLSSYTPAYAGTVNTKYGLRTQRITTAKLKTVRANSLQQKNVSFSLKARTNGDGVLSYKVVKGSSKYITVSKSGKVTLKKGCPKGSYQVMVTASGTAKCQKATKKVTIKVG